MKKIVSILLCITMILGFGSVVSAVEAYDINSVISDTANYLYKTVSTPQVGSIGGEWAILGLARSEENIPQEYFENYYQTVEKYVKDHNGILHNKKYTEYSRVIVALSSIGKNPQNVAGYNLLTPLGDYEKTVWQGINGAIWALIALDSKNYEIPQNSDATTQATRKMYVDHILEKQTSDGGWALVGDVADPDVTGMALQALSKYKNNDNVKTATEKALICLSNMQNNSGGFSSYDAENSESNVQVIVALCELGIPYNDARFVKNGNTVLDELMSYYNKGNGFNHTESRSGANLMATEQAFYGLVATKRFLEGKSSLFRMTDVASVQESYKENTGLTSKIADVKKKEITEPCKKFTDISDFKIEALAERGIIKGKTSDIFAPNDTVTRAEFAAIVTRGLGLPIYDKNIFSDVHKHDWFFSDVCTAYSYGITNGISVTEFSPNGTITREQSAVMIERAAKICGIENTFDKTFSKDILAGFTDYRKVSDWAICALAFCYDNQILPDDSMTINPQETITRYEVAQMLYNMLFKAKLI